jgi:hypothetical protein
MACSVRLSIREEERDEEESKGWRWGEEKVEYLE